MRRLLPLLLTTGFRLAVWCLLTADLSRLNLLAVPQAYLEALRLIVGREPEGEENSEATTDGTIPLLVFLDVFRITLTPFTIVLGLEDGGRRYRIHALTPGRTGGPTP